MNPRKDQQNPHQNRQETLASNLFFSKEHYEKFSVIFAKERNQQKEDQKEEQKEKQKQEQKKKKEKDEKNVKEKEESEKKESENEEKEERKKEEEMVTMRSSTNLFPIFSQQFSSLSSDEHAKFLELEGRKRRGESLSAREVAHLNQLLLRVKKEQEEYQNSLFLEAMSYKERYLFLREEVEAHLKVPKKRKYRWVVFSQKMKQIWFQLFHRRFFQENEGMC